MQAERIDMDAAPGAVITDLSACEPGTVLLVVEMRAPFAAASRRVAVDMRRLCGAALSPLAACGFEFLDRAALVPPDTPRPPAPPLSAEAPRPFGLWL